MKSYFSANFCYELDYLQFKPEEIKKLAISVIEKSEIEQIQNKIKEIYEEESFCENEHYLSMLLKLIEKRKDSTSVDRSFQTFAIFCMKPKYIFGKDNPLKFQKASKKEGYKKGEYPAYKQFIKHFYYDLGNYQQDIKLCSQYIERGTTKHNVERDTLPPKLYQEIEKDINASFNKYFHNLKGNGIEFKSHYAPTVYFKNDPEEDMKKGKTTILQKCFEREWLFPVSHILLARHAQYQLMGHKKYAAESLLESGSKCFSPNKLLSEEEKRQFSRLTIELSLDIKSAIDKKLRTVRTTNISHAFRKKILYESQQRNSGLFACLANLQKIELSNSVYREAFALCVPNCDTDILAVKLATKFDLNEDQMKLLSENLFDLLWSRINIKKQLHNLKFSNEEEINNITATIEAIREFINPKNFFIIEEQETLKSLEQAYKKLEKCGLITRINKPLTLEMIWKQFTSFFYLTDLTLIALWLSNSLMYHHSLKKMLPDFIKKCLKALEDNLEKYSKSKRICWLMGIDEISSQEKSDMEVNSKLLTLKDNISKEMTWEIAKQFLSQSIIEVETISNSEDRRKVQIDSLQKRWKNQIDEIGADKSLQKLVYYTAFTQTLRESFFLLEGKVMEKFIELSQSLLEVPDGGESL